jgi:DnaK suppressor protein
MLFSFLRNFFDSSKRFFAMSEIPMKLRYSATDLIEFRELIENKKAKAEKELAFYLSQLEELNNEGDGGRLKSLDDGTNAAEAERISLMVDRTAKIINHLESALIRIKNGTYGICSVTGKLIPRERLLLVPHATKTVEGKKDQVNT